jgi:vancomycin permeability regulator SanA
VRGVALFLALFTVANVAGDLRFARANTNLWWLDLWPLPLGLTRLALIVVAAALAIYALRPDVAPPVRRGARAVVVIAAVTAGISAVRFYALLARGFIHTSFPLPLSLIVAVLLAVIAARFEHERRARPRTIIITAVAAALVFPLLQVCFFGATDYRRPAAAIVVFGARAKADGTASDALADRVRTACDLYHAGFAPRIIMSGGPGEGSATEPQVMRALAQRMGVPESAIEEDPAGINTEATVRNTARMMAARPCVLAVSHFYHLPRIKITYQHYGVEAFTVPSVNSVPFSMPFNVVREDAAFWWYYARHFQPLT